MKPIDIYYENLAAITKNNLEKRQFECHYCKTAAEAVSLALDMVEPGSTVSFGGSMTLAESGMGKALAERDDITLLDRSKASSPEEVAEIYHQALSADYYFMSSNAITLEGELINTDGTGNANRLGRKTPCASTGSCADCLSPDCICSHTVITRRSAPANRIKVILIGEALGY